MFTTTSCSGIAGNPDTLSGDARFGFAKRAFSRLVALVNKLHKNIQPDLRVPAGQIVIAIGRLTGALMQVS
jgi:hypothetical protein